MTRSTVARIRPLWRTLTSLLAAGAAGLALVVAAPVAPVAAVVSVTFDQHMWQTDGQVRAVVETPTAVYLGGSFTQLIGPDGETVARSNVAALDPATGAPLPFVADTNRRVWELATSADYTRVYVVGEFTKLNGVTRKRAAAVDASTGDVLGFNPNLDGRVRALALSGSTVYLGGDFTSVNGASRARLVAVAAQTGDVVPTFAATADDSVAAIEITLDGSRLLVGGRFESISDTSSTSYLDSLNPTTGESQGWADRPDAEVIDIAVSATQVVAAVGGVYNETTVWDLANGARRWSVGGDGDPQAVAFH